EGDDSAAGPARQLRVVDLLDRGVLELNTLRQEPDLQVELRYTLGGLYHRLGHFDRAEPLLVAAWKEGREELGPRTPETIKAGLALAGWGADKSRLEGAGQRARESVDRATRLYGPGRPEVAGASATLGKVLAVKGDYKTAIPLLENAVKVLASRPPSVEL